MSVPRGSLALLSMLACGPPLRWRLVATLAPLVGGVMPYCGRRRLADGTSCRPFRQRRPLALVRRLAAPWVAARSTRGSSALLLGPCRLPLCPVRRRRLPPSVTTRLLSRRYLRPALYRLLICSYSSRRRRRLARVVVSRPWVWLRRLCLTPVTWPA